MDTTRFAGPVEHFLLICRATFLKNIKELIRYPVNTLFWVALPIIWSLPTYYLIMAFAPKGSSAGLLHFSGTSDYFSWIMVGLIAGQVISDTFWSLGFLLRHLMMLGVLETIWSSPIRPLTLIAAEALYRLVDITYSVIVVVILARVFFGFTLPAHFLASWPLWLPFLAIVLSAGVAFGALVLVIKDPGSTTDIGAFLIETLAGVRNPPQAMPRFLLFASLALPLTYAVDIIRVHALPMAPLVPYGIELTVFLVSAAVLPIIAGHLFNRSERFSRRTGRLAGY